MDMYLELTNTTQDQFGPACSDWGALRECMQVSCVDAVRAVVLQTDSVDATDLVVFSRSRLEEANLTGSVGCRRREASQPPRPRIRKLHLYHPFLIRALHSTDPSSSSDSALFTTLQQSPPWLSHLSSIVRHTLFWPLNDSISLVKLHSFAFARHPPM